LIESYQKSNYKWCRDYRCNRRDWDQEEAMLSKFSYERKDDKQYVLCTTFNFDSKEQEFRTRRWSKPAHDFKAYKAGEHCFTLKAKPAKEGQKCR